jgi:hypothetical protein
MLSPGTMVGPYRIEEHVGAEGTMAEVYRAVDYLGQAVAVKLLGPPSGQAQREATVVSSLNSLYIVGTYDVREHEGRLCLIQEWVEGESLAAVLDAAGRLDLTETVKVGREMASALAYAHALGALHRDIKPSNVLRSRSGHYKLVDFGAVGLLEPGSGQTRSGQIAGTPLYMSPEQVAGRPQTVASDIFGLGLLLFRCLYGTTPGESAENYLQLLVGRTQTPIDVPPSPLRGLITRCLAIDPERRPQSATEVLDELLRIDLGPVSSPPLQYPPSQPGYAYPQQGTVPPVPPSGGPSRPGVSGYRVTGPVTLGGSGVAPAVAAGVLVVAGGLVLAWLLAPAPADLGFWLRIAVGLVVAGGALLVAGRVRRLVSRAPDTERQAASILTGAGGRDALTRSMVLEVDQVVARLKGLDAKFLGYTMVMLIREAEEATESADRVAALIQMVTLMEKLVKQLSPWHVRHKEAIATVIAIVGALVGIASVVSGFLR